VLLPPRRHPKRTYAGYVREQPSVRRRSLGAPFVKTPGELAEVRLDEITKKDLPKVGSVESI